MSDRRLQGWSPVCSSVPFELQKVEWADKATGQEWNYYVRVSSFTPVLATIEQTAGKGSPFNNSWSNSKLRHDELGVFLILSSLVSPFLFFLGALRGRSYCIQFEKNTTGRLITLQIKYKGWSSNLVATNFLYFLAKSYVLFNFTKLETKELVDK